ncbi:MAG: flavin reductase family protein [Rhodobacteraceae bacterium]|uniref:flavin reductase family protein n=1 Tax=Amaricoccus sp. B4 TaxID=3368557 RepID=UPI000DABB9CD|nr:flavin reductase family protein [Paracoccaceae bacterium]
MPEFDQRELRDALGHFATGVAVVTADGARGPVGITINSFASVSLDPPLVLWSLARGSDRFECFTGTEYFTIHVLPAGEKPLALRFATLGRDFEGLELETGIGGTPLLATYAARFECRTAACHDGGDHVILVGEVLRLCERDVPPLLFHRGGFKSLTLG